MITAEDLDERKFMLSLKWSIILTAVINAILLAVQFVIHFSDYDIRFHIFVLLFAITLIATVYFTYKEKENALFVCGLALGLLLVFAFLASLWFAGVVLILLIVAVVAFAFLLKTDKSNSPV